MKQTENSSEKVNAAGHARCLVISMHVRTLLSLLGRQDGRGGAEEAHIPQDHLLRRAPRPAAWHVLQAAYAVVQCAPAAVAESGVCGKQHSLLKQLRKAQKEVLPMEKPEVVKTHLREMIVLPKVVGSMVSVYNGKTFNQVEIKPEMIGHHLGEFSITYKLVRHGWPGIGATQS